MKKTILALCVVVVAVITGLTDVGIAGTPWVDVG